MAKLRLADFIQDKQEEMGDSSSISDGKMTMAEAITIFRQRLEGQQNIKEGAKVYRRKCLAALLKSWPELEQTTVSKISKDDCLAWARKFADYNPSVYNNTVGTLRMLFEVAIEKGARA